MSMVPVMHPNTQEVQVSFGNVFTYLVGDIIFELYARSLLYMLA